MGINHPLFNRLNVRKCIICFKDVFALPGLTVALGTVSGVLGAVVLTLIAVIIALIFKLKNRGNGTQRGKYNIYNQFKQLVSLTLHVSEETSSILLIYSSEITKAPPASLQCHAPSALQKNAMFKEWRFSGGPMVALF